MSFFSILMPVYNTSRFLNAAINSVLEQQFPDYEFLILDDGSTDHSLAMLRDYEAADSRIHVYHQENQGLLRTRKRLIEYASGEYLVFLDSDDTLADSALETLYQQLMQTEDDVLICDYDFVDEQGNYLRSPEPDSVPDEQFLSQTQLMLLLCETSAVNTIWRKVIRRSCFNDAPCWEDLPRLMMGEDKLISAFAFQNQSSGRFLHKVLYHYRVVPSSATARYKLSYLQDFQYVRNSIFQLLQRNESLCQTCMQATISNYVNDLVWYLRLSLKNHIGLIQLHRLLPDICQSAIFCYAKKHPELLSGSQTRRIKEIQAGLLLLLLLDSVLLRNKSD